MLTAKNIAGLKRAFCSNQSGLAVACLHENHHSLRLSLILLCKVVIRVRSLGAILPFFILLISVNDPATRFPSTLDQGLN